MNAYPKPVLMTQAELLSVLDDIRRRVEAGDSFEGNLAYSIPEAEDAPADGFDVVACYRIGNLQGQGGMRMLGDWSAGSPAGGDPPIAITSAQFAELKAMLDADAGKEHSANGSVVSSLQGILAMHQQMVLEAAAQFARSRAELAVKNGWDGTALYRFAEMLDGAR